MPLLLMLSVTLNLLLFWPELFSFYFAVTLVAVVLGRACFEMFMSYFKTGSKSRMCVAESVSMEGTNDMVSSPWLLDRVHPCRAPDGCHGALKKEAPWRGQDADSLLPPFCLPYLAYHHILGTAIACLFYSFGENVK